MKVVKAILLAAVILSSVSAVRAQISLGIEIGTPPPPRVIVAPHAPAPGYIWVEGYWYPVGHHYRWHDGYWTRPPYEGAYWVRPRYEDGRYFVGYWNGKRGRVEHDHRWDHDRDRDFHHDNGKHNGHAYGHDHGRDHRDDHS